MSKIIRNNRTALFTGQNIAIFGIIIFLGTFFEFLADHPIHPWNTFFYLALIGFPLWICIYAIIRFIFRTKLAPKWSSSSNPFPLPILATLMLVYFSIGFIFGLNKWCDKSPIEVHKFTITKKFHPSRKVFEIYFQTSGPSPLPIMVGNRDSVEIFRDEYDSIKPGQSTVTIRLRQGYFGFPWIDGHQISP